MSKATVPLLCPRCGCAMRLLGKAGSDPCARYWECVNRSPFDENACTGYAMTDADAPLSVDDIALSLLVAEPDQHGQRDKLVAEADQLAERLSFRLSSEPGIYQYLSNGEYRTLSQAAEILCKLVSAGQQAKQIDRNVSAPSAQGGSRATRSICMEGFKQFATGHDRATLLERCRVLDRYLKYRSNKGANIEKAVDLLVWADTQADRDRAWSALTYRVGFVWHYELEGNLSHADFEQYWGDWKASRQVRAAIDRALGQDGEF